MPANAPFKSITHQPRIPARAAAASAAKLCAWPQSTTCDDGTIESALGLKLGGLERTLDVEMEGRIGIATRPGMPPLRPMSDGSRA